MRVAHQLLAQRPGTLKRPPHLPPPQEHALIAGEAVDDLRGLAAKRRMVGVERDEDAAEVSDVLAHRRASVDVQARELRERVGLVLGPELGRLRLELRRVLGRPPVPKTPAAIGLPPLIVEAVADLVTDDAADPAVVHGWVRIGIEERRLEDGGWED